MDELRALMEYNRWAHLRMLDALDELSPDELARDLKSSFPSVRETLLHAYGAEWVWLRRWTGESPTGLPEEIDTGSVRALRDRWDALWQEQLGFMEGLDDATLAGEIAYRNFAGDPHREPLSDLMRHVVNHATYHRGQLATMLRQLGRKPPSTDYVRYVRETGG